MSMASAKLDEKYGAGGRQACHQVWGTCGARKLRQSGVGGGKVVRKFGAAGV